MIRKEVQLRRLLGTWVRTELYYFAVKSFVEIARYQTTLPGTTGQFHRTHLKTILTEYVLEVGDVKILLPRIYAVITMQPIRGNIR